jgi:hypothetical protein
VPVAVNCCVSPLAIDALVGVTAIELSVDVPPVTVSVTAGEVTPLRLAVIWLLPAATPVAKPLDVIVATEVVTDTHVTDPVIFCVLKSL